MRVAYAFRQWKVAAFLDTMTPWEVEEWDWWLAWNPQDSTPHEAILARIGAMVANYLRDPKKQQPFTEAEFRVERFAAPPKARTADPDNDDDRDRDRFEREPDSRPAPLIYLPGNDEPTPLTPFEENGEPVMSAADFRALLKGRRS